jgi:hypothetical protein
MKTITVTITMPDEKYTPYHVKPSRLHASQGRLEVFDQPAGAELQDIMDVLHYHLRRGNVEIEYV